MAWPSCSSTWPKPAAAYDSSLCAQKIPLRGASCIGTGVEDDDIGFYGPALAEAYHLESELADYPRIVISDPLSDFIKLCPLEQTGIADKYIQDFFKICQSLIAQDADGQTIIDYLGKGSRELFSNSPTLAGAHRDCVNKSREFVEAEFYRLCIMEASRPRAEEKPRTSPAEKYVRLKSYFESRIQF